MKDKVICVLCEEIRHTVFFSNMEEAFLDLGYKFIYLVTDISVYFQMKRKVSGELILVCRKNIDCCDLDNVINSKEVIEKSLRIEDANKLYQSVIYYLQKLDSISLILASQGIKVAELAAKEYARKNNIPILFCELANIPGKTFWDIDGSNAKSWLYDHIGVLDTYDIDDTVWENWKDNYINRSLKKHLVKQKVNVRDFNFLYGLLNRFNFLFTGLKLKELDLIFKLKSYFLARKIEMVYDKFDIKNNDYIFFPMQVASDSQIILNSDVDLFEALDYSIEKSKKENTELIVKLHPAEKDVNVIKKVLEYREKHHFKIVEDNTFEVIYFSNYVITINSTVGLEAMILDKPVEFLGRTYYKNFDHERLKNYILGYLVDLDFFSDKEFDKDSIYKLLKNR